MRFLTKKKRLLAIFDAYQKRFDKTAVTMDEVSEWALTTGLYPCPKRGDSEAECLDWERRLAEAEAT